MLCPFRSFSTSRMARAWTGGRTAYCCTKCSSDSHLSTVRTRRSSSPPSPITTSPTPSPSAKRPRSCAKEWAFTFVLHWLDVLKFLVTVLDQESDQASRLQHHWRGGRQGTRFLQTHRLGKDWEQGGAATLQAQDCKCSFVTTYH